MRTRARFPATEHQIRFQRPRPRNHNQPSPPRDTASRHRAERPSPENQNARRLHTPCTPGFRVARRWPGRPTGCASGGVMSLHKLTAGTGYTYLTRQVAAHDRTGGPRTPLATYYTERGETPGHWVGSGMTGVDGLQVGDEVTAPQMQALFGAGLHPLAAQRRERLEGPDLKERDFKAVTRLGVPFAVTSPDVTAFQVEVARRIEELAASLGHPRDYPIPAQDRARIRTQVAVEMFRAEHDRDPKDARELSGAIAKLTRSAHDRGRRIRPDLLPGEVGQHPVGGRPTGGRRAGRAGPQRGGRRRVGVHREARPVHQGGRARGASGRRDRAGRDRVHPPRLTRRGPGPAHPRRGREQGANPVREVALDRRADPVQGQRLRLGDLQHRPGEAPANPPRAGLRRAARHRPDQTPDP